MVICVTTTTLNYGFIQAKPVVQYVPARKFAAKPGDYDAVSVLQSKSNDFPKARPLTDFIYNWTLFSSRL